MRNQIEFESSIFNRNKAEKLKTLPEYQKAVGFFAKFDEKEIQRRRERYEYLRKVINDRGDYSIPHKKKVEMKEEKKTLTRFFEVEQKHRKNKNEIDSEIQKLLTLNHVESRRVIFVGPLYREYVEKSNHFSIRFRPF